MDAAIRWRAARRRHRIDRSARAAGSSRMSTAIRFDHVSKRYALKRAQGLRVERGILRALDDLSFEVQPGEVIGLIGANGSGKSTMLKLMAGIARPSQGQVEIRGRVGSLIELGAGFHPE